MASNIEINLRESNYIIDSQVTLTAIGYTKYYVPRNLAHHYKRIAETGSEVITPRERTILDQITTLYVELTNIAFGGAGRPPPDIDEILKWLGRINQYHHELLTLVSSGKNKSK